MKFIKILFITTLVVIIFTTLYTFFRATRSTTDNTPTPTTRQGSTIETEVTGNLVRNNPGMERGVWYVLYEERGKPALTKALQFSPQSVCAIGDGNPTCEPQSLAQADRVRIIGTEIDTNTIKVLRLEKL